MILGARNDEEARRQGCSSYWRQAFARNFAALKELEATYPGQIKAVAGDATQQEDLKRLVGEAIQAFGGVDRRFNRRFMALANHYLFEPVACTPASGWEKGQIENQVGNVRE